jgi:hypothetical protein
MEDTLINSLLELNLQSIKLNSILIEQNDKMITIIKKLLEMIENIINE